MNVFPVNDSRAGRSGYDDHCGEEMSTYLFEKPLIRGTMLKRKSQFTALVDIDGEELIAHIPTTNRLIGYVDNIENSSISA